MSLKESDTPVALIAPGGSGTWKNNCYHTRDCHAIQQAKPANIREIPEQDRERYHMRECTNCQTLKTSEVLEG